MTKSQKNILVAEDEEEVAEQIKRVLSVDYEVDSVADGLEALQMMNTGKNYDLAILALLIPKVNGMEVCKTMIGDSNLKNVPVLLTSVLPLSSASFQKSWKKYEELRVVKDVLDKPFADKDLLAKVKMILSLPRLS